MACTKITYNFTSSKHSIENTVNNKVIIKSLVKYMGWFLFCKTNIIENVWDYVLKDDKKTNLSSYYSALNINFATVLQGKYFIN